MKRLLIGVAFCLLSSAATAWAQPGSGAVDDDCPSLDGTPRLTLQYFEDSHAVGYGYLSRGKYNSAEAAFTQGLSKTANLISRSTTFITFEAVVGSARIESGDAAMRDLHISLLNGRALALNCL